MTGSTQDMISHLESAFAEWCAHVDATPGANKGPRPRYEDFYFYKELMLAKAMVDLTAALKERS